MAMATDKADVVEGAIATDKPDPFVKRGPNSWNYFYIALGFALSIWGTIIQMVDVLRFPCNVLLYVVTGAGLVWLFLFNGWFQNKLIGWKNSYENTPR
jgi:hypothetical protein